VGTVGGRYTEFQEAQPVSFGILRREFDEFLLRGCGARLRLGVPTTRLRRRGDLWIVDESIRTPVVVGAGGQRCPVAQALNGLADPAAVVVTRELEFRMDARQVSACRVRGEVPQIYFSRDLEGYGWCVRKGEHLNIGLGRKRPSRLNEHVREFMTFLLGLGEVPADVPTSGWRGYAYRLHHGAPRQVVGDGVLLVGDAAGLASPTSGEGIRPAVLSGLLAARVVADAGGRHARGDLEPYAVALDRALGRRRRRSAVLPWLPAALASRLLAARWFARHVVIGHMFLAPDRLSFEPRLRLGVHAEDDARRAS
jgi:flavin-dependent dehydrogenase